MRFRFPLIILIFTAALLAAPGWANAKHRYFASFMPLTNYVNRCLGFGWSDGYHAPGGWSSHHRARSLHAVPSRPVFPSYDQAMPYPPRHPMSEFRHGVPTKGVPQRQPRPATPLPRP